VNSITVILFLINNLSSIVDCYTIQVHFNQISLIDLVKKINEVKINKNFICFGVCFKTNKYCQKCLTIGDFQSFYVSSLLF